MQRVRMNSMRSQNNYRRNDRDPEDQRDKGVSFFTQTKLLFVKNWLTKKRTEPKKLLGEIFLPVLYLFLLSFLVRLDQRKTYPEATVPYETPQNVLNSLHPEVPFDIHVVHNSNPSYGKEITNLMKTVLERDSDIKIRANETLNFIFYPNVSALMKTYYDDSFTTIDAAIILPETVSNLTYTIKINPDRSSIPMPTNKKVGLETCRGLQLLNLTYSQTMRKIPDVESSITCPVNGYFFSNFLALQYLVDQALIMKTVGPSVPPNPIRVQILNYPKEAYTAGMSTFLRVVIPLYCIIPLAQLINTLLILIVTEKEDKIKDGLKMIGVSDTAYWFSWFGIYGLMATLFAVMFTLVMHFMNILRNINIVILFLLFLFFGLSIITFAFSLTPFFHKPKTAGAVGTLIMQFTGMLFLLQTFLNDSSSGVLIPLRLISSLAFTTAIDNACAYEYQGGIGLSDLLPGRKGSGILYSLIFLAADTLLYGLFAIYLDNILPNEFGIRKHPLFCFKPSFWFGGTNNNVDTDSMNCADEIEQTENDNVEKVHPSLIGKESIRILNMRKTYGSWPSTNIVQAVKGISLDIYEGQITAILGRNGAGKSTLLNMMTGLVAPTSGRCVVFGLDITDPYDMARLRRMTGVCMQQDLHFKALTVQEHLEFYGRMRGISQPEMNEEIDSLLDELQLTDQRNVVSSKLSGGQRRKLSVGIALIGSPQIILLDEPSAGVDPVSRRHLWALLQKKKEGRVILLTTHFMDEADVLADRKAIVHDGQLKCVGSSLFLKRRFGVGYYLTVELDERSPTGEESDNLVKNWIPEAVKSKKMIASEVKYALPHSEVQKFSSLFADIEGEIASGTSAVKSYGVSMTTLEEVFLKISNDLDVVPDKTKELLPHRRMSQVSVRSLLGNQPSAVDNCSEVSVDEQNLIPNVGEIHPDSKSIFWAICLLRMRRLIRSPQSLFFMIVMPVILVAAGFALVKTQNVDVSESQLVFSSSGDSKIYPKSDSNIAISSNAPLGITNFMQNSGLNVKSYSGIYADLLTANRGVGTMGSIKIQNSAIRPTESEVLINGTYLHVPGIMLNRLSQYSLISQGSSQKIKTVHQPFPSKNQKVFDQTTFYAVFLIGPAFTFAAVGMVMEMVRDREIKARNHLRVNGLSFEMYFSSIFLVFATLSLIVTVMEIIVVYAFSVAAFMNPYAMTVVIILLILFIAPCLLFSAAFSYFFDQMESAQSVFSQVCSWMGSIVGITIILVDAFAAPHVTMMLHAIFCALDIFYIPFGIFYWINKQYILCTVQGTCDELSFKNYLGPEFYIMGIAMLVQIPIFGLFLLIADVRKNGGKMSHVFKTLRIRRESLLGTVAVSPENSDSINGNDDADVTAEKTRVSEYFSCSDPNSKCVVAVEDLRKSYKCKNDKSRSLIKKTYRKNVLKGINVMVEEGEVFGLLGHNGAGKTSAMKMIIAEEAADSGRIQLCGHDIKSNMSDAFSKLGYCPQHDALWENITLREHMELYAIIRGVQTHMRAKLIQHFLNGLQIGEHAEKKANELSGGTKRKLSYCMSMLGAPKIVLLDEPSSGMDIMSKRFLWNTVLGTFKDSRGAILTTHSMEEADALCTRIAIMVKGSLMCIGSPQHLKSKFGDGYTLEIKLKMSEGEEVLVQSSVNNLHLVTEVESDVVEKFKFVQEHFPDSKLTEVFGNRAVYSIPNSSVRSVSQTFALLEQLKQEFNVEEYSFSQTTLEQVFLQFAKDNEEDHEIAL